MRVHAHTKFCFLCVLTFLFNQCSHCHSDGHHHHEHGDGDLGHGHSHSRSGHEHDHDHDEVHSDLQISQAPYVGPSKQPAAAGGGGVSGVSDAETEQRYYIQQLFHLYGQDDRLSFGAFQKLLLSLGLGEVKVLGLKHDEHDHMAHLDLLEVQEGQHSHTATDHSHHTHGHEHHSHGHDGGRHTTHSHHHHAEAGGGHTTAMQGTYPCSPNSAGPTVDSGPMDRHNHNHHQHSNAQDHGHDHDHDEDNEHKPTHDHSHDPPTAAGNHTADSNELSQAPPHHHHEHHHKHPHQHPHNHNHELQPPANNTGSQTPSPRAPRPTHLPAQPTRAPQRPTVNSGSSVGDLSLREAGPTQAPTQAPVTRAKRPRKPPRGRGQRNRNRPAPTAAAPAEIGQDHGHDIDHDHDHDHHHEHHDHSHDHSHSPSRREKREAPTKARGALPGEQHDDPQLHPHQHHAECLNLTELLNHYGLSLQSTISPKQFTYLCPALLYQIDRRLCIRHLEHEDIQSEQTATTGMVWVWGFVSITIISLLSLLGVVLVPILNQSCFKFLLTFLVALAVGTLSGDALLHLLPHSQGTHDHEHGKHMDEDVDLLEEFDAVWKSLTALGGIYLLFIIEHCLGMFKHFKDQGGTLCRRKKRGQEAKIGRKLSDHKLNRRSDAEWMHLKPLTDGSEGTALSGEGSHNDTQPSDQLPDSPCLTPLALTDGHHEQLEAGDHQAKENGRKAKTKKHGHGHSHSHGHSHGHCHSDQEMKDAGIASIAWMVIMGDGMHNFSDGLAIGAAFSANITGGISTSVAVFCHELPHELGDFAVLLKAGMSVKQAIVYNVLSALMAYVGMLIGTAVGQYTHNVTSWIFAVTAGMFLYVALVDMLPEMLHGDSEEHKRCQLGHFLLQNLGMLTGFAIMLLIAIFEDRIKFDFDL